MGRVLSLEQVTEIEKKVRSTIILSLSDSIIKKVAKEKIMAKLWAKVENLYMTKSLLNKLYIKKRTLTLKMAEGSSLEEYIDEFNKVCDTFETIDKGKALFLVSSLPLSYSNFIDTLIYSRQTLSSYEVKASSNTKGLQKK